MNERHMPDHKIGCLSKFRKEEIDEWIRNGDDAKDHKDGAKE